MPLFFLYRIISAFVSNLLKFNRLNMKRKFKKECVTGVRLKRIENKCDRILRKLADSRSDTNLDSLIGKMYKAAGELERMARSDLYNSES